MDLNINDGRTEFHINGDPNRVIRVNLNDDNIAIRARKVKKELQRLAREAQESLAETDDEILDENERFDKEARREINHVFDYDVSTPVFGEISPLAVVDDKGTLYVEAFFEGIIPVIEKERQEKLKAVHERAKKSREKISKYTGKYENATHTPDTT